MAGGWKTYHVPRRTWLDSKIDVFLEELAASGREMFMVLMASRLASLGKNWQRGAGA